MKLFVCFTFTIMILITFINHSACSKEKQAMLSNQEIREVLKCFGDLNLEEGCVVCRYITQKIYKVLDISAMCPDIVETKLLNQREREWKPDPQVINKWTVLYNLQKDYMERILPQIEATKNYDDIMHQKILREKIEKENLSNLIQFQNKVNSDLMQNERSDKTKFDSDDQKCDDEGLEYKHTQTVGAEKLEKTPNLTDFNKMLLKEMKNKNKNLHDVSKNSLDPNNISLLQQSMKNFFSKKNGFNFMEKEGNPENTKIEKNENEIKVENQEINKKENHTENKISNSNKIPEPKYLNEEVMELNLEDAKSSVDFNKLVSNMNLGKGEKIEYLGTSIGSPYAGLDEEKVQNKLEKLKEEVGSPEIKKVHFMNEKQNKKKKENPTDNNNSDKPKDEKDNTAVIKKTKKESGNNLLKQQIQKTKDKNQNQNEDINLNFAQKSETGKISRSKISASSPKHSSIFNTYSEPVLKDSFDPLSQINSKILNPPMSFIEATNSDIITLDQGMFDNLLSKSNFNLETQRRGRRRSRFPDPQWDCAEAQISKLVRYLCEEEVSTSYQKYCKPIFEQINTMIESYLYHDNNLEICQNLHMCPVSVDI